MDILGHENLFDLLVLLLLATAFVVGFLQGTVRRLIGIASVLFALVLASQLRGPVGDYLAGNWVQFPPGYTRMLAFGAIFLITVVVAAVVTELYWERGPFFPRQPLVDPLLGGFLGLVEMALMLGVLILVLDSYFLTPDLIVSPGEFVVVRDFNHAVDVSRTAALYRHDLFPAFFFLVGLLIPQELRNLYPR